MRIGSEGYLWCCLAFVKRVGNKKNCEAIDTMVEGVQQLLEEHPEVGVFIEQPQGSSLRGDKRMSTLGLRVVELDGCAYGLQHQKPYVLWTNLSVQEFSPRVTEQFCPYCAARPKQQHPQGMCPKKGSSQPRVRLLGYAVDAARNRMPWDLGGALAAAPGTPTGAISQAVATVDAVPIYRTRVIRAP